MRLFRKKTKKEMMKKRVREGLERKRKEEIESVYLIVRESFLNYMIDIQPYIDTKSIGFINPIEIIDATIVYFVNNLRNIDIGTYAILKNSILTEFELIKMLRYYCISQHLENKIVS